MPQEQNRPAYLLGAVLGAALLTGAAQAQTIPSATDPGWRFSLTPYLWVPNVSGELRYGPSNGSAANVNMDAQNIIDSLKFGLTFGAEARYGRFTLATDLLYLDLGNSSSQVRSVDFGASGRVQATANLGTQTSLSSTLWTLAPGYTLLEGAWGNLDLQAGFRVMAMRSRTNVQLVTDVTGPRQGETFTRTGRLSASDQIWDGIIGIRGRIELGSGFYLPYAADVGGGGSNLTWQLQGGVGYSTGWAGVVAGYRYLSYSQNGSAHVQELNMGGPFIALNMKF
ncbi:MAG: hypothetical protein WCP77_00375 [Roseococcus sp.]